MIVVGIDPGLSGAIAVRDTKDNLRGALRVYDMPVIEVELTAKGKGGKPKKRRHINAPALAQLLYQLYLEGADRVIVEEVSAMPGQGVTSMFRFGEAFGIVKGAVAGVGLPAEFVRPATWKRAMGLGRDKGSARKRITDLFPKLAAQFARVKDDGRAEAALLTFYKNEE